MTKKYYEKKHVKMPFFKKILGKTRIFKRKKK